MYPRLHSPGQRLTQSTRLRSEQDLRRTGALPGFTAPGGIPITSRAGSVSERAGRMLWFALLGHKFGCTQGVTGELEQG